ncbi:phage integrase N-terminal SAM-like domain-containing protein [Immundisolibacter sp.]|uniref:phage integrase N-terminal SAM-like domain-containing protein n=1 Tax=Immundisolibacter sp. TaxID=1934948 RepID=UPI003D112D6E
MRDRNRIKHYSIRAETQYVQWVRRFILFHGKRHPREMGAGEVDAFLSHLAVDGKVAAATQNQRAVRVAFTPSTGRPRARGGAVSPVVSHLESGRLSINNPDTAFTHRLPSASRISPST